MPTNEWARSRPPRRLLPEPSAHEFQAQNRWPLDKRVQQQKASLLIHARALAEFIGSYSYWERFFAFSRRHHGNQSRRKYNNNNNMRHTHEPKTNPLAARDRHQYNSRTETTLTRPISAVHTYKYGCDTCTYYLPSAESLLLSLALALVLVLVVLSSRLCTKPKSASLTRP